MVGALVEHDADDEADVGAAAVDYADQRWRARQRLRVAPLDYWSHVLEHDVAAWTLRQAIRDLPADHLAARKGVVAGSFNCLRQR